MGLDTLSKSATPRAGLPNKLTGLDAIVDKTSRSLFLMFRDRNLHHRLFPISETAKFPSHIEIRSNMVAMNFRIDFM